MPGASIFAKPSHEAVLARVERSVMGDALETSTAKVAPAIAQSSVSSRRAFMGLFSNFSDHLRTIRNLTISRHHLNDARNSIAELRQQSAELRQQVSEVRTLSQENRALKEKIRALESALASARSELGQELAGLHRMADLQRQSYVDITRRLSAGANDASRPTRGKQAAIAADPFIDLFYREFEDRFRGSREEILDRLREYVPHLTFLEERRFKDGIVVDLGCGRGEWLEILRSEGIDAIGIDTNERQAQAAKELGLNVVISDAIEWMVQQKDRSVSLLSAMHVIEHMQFDQIVRLLKEAARILKPGGGILLETPNPESLIVGAYKFWFDPTHVRPYPPELISQLLESLGFEQIDVLRLHPDGRNREYRDAHAVPKPVADLLAGPLDYAILCRKP